VVTARRRNNAVVWPYILSRIRMNVAVTHQALGLNFLSEELMPKPRPSLPCNLVGDNAIDGLKKQISKSPFSRRPLRRKK
jgi:hypothetical protein